VVDEGTKVEDGRRFSKAENANYFFDDLIATRTGPGHCFATFPRTQGRDDLEGYNRGFIDNSRTTPPFLELVREKEREDRVGGP
jgi:hypothetical protein